MFLEFIVVGVAGALFTRCVAWHVPKLALMVWRGLRQPRPEPAPLVDAEAALDRVWLDSCAMWERYEVRLFAEVPSAWWLDPARWGEAAKPRISSETRHHRRFDVKQGTVPAQSSRDLAYLESVARQDAQNAYDQHLQSAARQNALANSMHGRLSNEEEDWMPS